ncbi:MAG: hypothetical protein J6C28_03370 [Bacilli bacterium]|nr:hypothetical protein [Bacilli bacterium]
MIKKLIRVTLILLLSVFSFYYTNKSVELVREKDPIMKTIKSTNEKYNVQAVNAEIKDNTIIPGLTGKEINYLETYNKMKQYGTYNEILTTLKDIEPTISVDDYYDKYIISGNPIKRSISLVFKVETSSPKEILSILKNNNVPATFFIDGIYLENNTEEIVSMNNHELELLSYDKDYDEIFFSASKDYLESLTNKNLKYCYSEYEKEEVINLCQKLKLHTIIPTITINKSLFKETKEKLTNSAIISIPISENTKKELDTTIKYIKSRGYSLKTLEDLLSENYEK